MQFIVCELYFSKKDIHVSSERQSEAFIAVLRSTGESLQSTSRGRCRTGAMAGDPFLGKRNPAERCVHSVSRSQTVQRSETEGK